MTLQPGEEAVALLEICEDALGFYDDDMKYRSEDGLFRVYVGGNSRDCLMAEIEMKFKKISINMQVSEKTVNNS